MWICTRLNETHTTSDWQFVQQEKKSPIYIIDFRIHPFRKPTTTIRRTIWCWWNFAPVFRPAKNDYIACKQTQTQRHTYQHAPNSISIISSFLRISSLFACFNSVLIYNPPHTHTLLAIIHSFGKEKKYSIEKWLNRQFKGISRKIDEKKQWNLANIWIISRRAFEEEKKKNLTQICVERKRCVAFFFCNQKLLSHVCVPVPVLVPVRSCV